MKAIVDQDICIGCRLCTETCPEVYRMDDDKAFAYAEPESKEIEECCEKAADECPVEAITIED